MFTLKSIWIFKESKINVFISIWNKFLLEEKMYFERGSNSRPSACEADVITTTPSKHSYVYRAYRWFCKVSQKYLIQLVSNFLDNLYQNLKKKEFKLYNLIDNYLFIKLNCGTKTIE